MVKLKKKESFTLIEILVSITLISLISVIVFSVLWTGLKVKKQSRKISQEYMGARIFLDVMGYEIRSAFDFNFPGYKNFVWEEINNNTNPIKKKLSFWGLECDSMQLKMAGKLPISRITYYVKEEKDQDEKIRRIIYRKEKPLWSMQNSRINEVEGPVIEGDFNLKAIYPPDQNYPNGNINKLPIRVVINFKTKEDEREKEVKYTEGIIRNVYLSQYEK